jgi:signal transduction histidine kinase
MVGRVTWGGIAAPAPTTGPGPSGARPEPVEGRRRVLVRVPPQRLAEVLLGVLVVSYGALAMVGVVFGAENISTGLASGVPVVALLALQLGYLSRPDRRPRAPGKYVALALQAALVLAPIALLGPDWHGFPGILAGSALLVLPPMAGLPVFVLVVVVVVLISSPADSPQTADLGHLETLAYVTTSTITAGVAVFGLTTLVRLTVEGYRTRDELNHAAVVAERTRFAARLQDAVGEALSSIALRGELVAHLVGEHTERAGAELRTLVTRARSALADARTLTRTRERLEATSGGPPGPRVAAGPAPVIARVLLLVVLLDFTVLAVISVAAAAGPVAAAVTAGVRVAELLLVMVLTQRSDRLGLRARWAGLAVLALLVFVPVWWLPPGAHGAEAWLIGTALVVLPRERALPVAVLGWFGAVVVEYANPSPSISLLYSVTYFAVGTLVSASIVWGLGTVVRLLGEMREAREQLRAMAVATERERLARDVHDMLGLGLTTITVKCELALRLLDTDAGRARGELTEAMGAARRSLADVRLVHEDSGAMSLGSECRVVDSALRAADIGVRLEVEGALADPATHGTTNALAVVLREGVTNVLRHSRATWCAITIRVDADGAALEIVNDGVGDEPDGGGPDGGGGTGLRNMRARMGAVGGTLDARRDGCRYRLHAVAPPDPCGAHGPEVGPEVGTGAGSAGQGAPGLPARAD